MLKQRILTALVLLPLMIIMLFFSGSLLWAAFAALIALLALWEYSRLAQIPSGERAGYLGSAGVFMLLAHLGDWQLPPLAWGVVLAFWLLLMPLWLHQKWKLHGGARAKFLGWLLMIPFWFSLVQLRPDNDAAGHLLAIMVLVWLADSAAYFAGRAFGKRKLAPVLSPKKSWEGAIGGVLAVLIYVTFARNAGWLSLGDSWLGAMMAATVLTFVSIGGDLLESWFKRAADIKDSSNLLPGHGGVFDRVDSLMAVLVVYAAVVNICG
ncbi:phosphatidate cytidylyltransferase [Neisseriaceae bacterium B1]